MADMIILVFLRIFNELIICGLLCLISGAPKQENWKVGIMEYYAPSF